MELQRTRIFLLISLFIVGFTLYSAWQREHAPLPITNETQPLVSATTQGTQDIPDIVKEQVVTSQTTAVPLSQEIEVTTDVLKVKIDTLGGDIIRAELVKYPQSLDTPSQGVVVLDHTQNRNYIAQTGLIGKDEKGPDSKQLGRAHFTSTQTHYQLAENTDVLQVDLLWQHPQGIHVIKTYVFKRGNYLVDVNYQINNPMDTLWQGSFYGQIKREFVKEKSSGLMGVQMYQGAALYTKDKPYKKISFSDMKKETFKEEIKGGWAALLERYFLCAFIPSPTTLNNYYTRVDENNIYNIGAVSAVEVAPNSRQTIGGQIYVGPEVADTLKEISPGLNLTIDYGILWPISQLLFWLLKSIHSFVGNWGWSIIFVTLIIKAAFYKLSATSYRSMGKMRRLQPRVEMLKERFKDDKQQFSMALMDLYRKEKMNPLGGCLPIIIQIPVFIALYYVLLESVELRQAPFMLWIQDLSIRDPFYVLPLIMGATMFIQQRMNPAPPDPIQAKIMLLMPVIFTVLFLSFPAGLVLYWTVNNLLSILQQWYITRSLATPSVELLPKSKS